ncbi:recombinase family protein [Vibrio alginolyticus]|uniref:recombinase family protein n=1 Tax=Vibrio alginolyticus TaxID=663 RepID=UPI00215FB142|nr:recombinase family protein [Vibrio alginolyticus]MCS0187464.1 recombinase family protein [Vibrio alginolyticus]
MRTAYSYVRLSSKRQIQGYGKERQWEAIQSAAHANGWFLSDKTFSDLGVSGWKGANIETGALSQFLRCVEDGVVESGSILLVENVDRLSRAGVNKAVTLLLQLLDNGISIYTFTDRKLYEPDSPNPLMDLMGWALTAQRAYEESSRKSQMILDAKSKAQEEARKTGKIITRRCPSWLKVNEDKTAFEFVPERVATVKRIFELYLGGYGSPRIGRKLTEEGREPLIGKHWYPRSVSRILQYRAVIGEYQPTSGGKIVGEPIRDYYPAVIDIEQFREAQGIIKEGGAGKGRRSNEMRNTFAGLLRCSCGQGMHIVSSVSKGTRYFQLRCVQYQIDCFRGTWNYTKFSLTVLFGLRRLPLLDVMGTTSNMDLKGLNNRVRELMEELESVKAQVDNTVNAIAAVGINTALEVKLKELTAQAAKTEKHLDSTKEELEAAHGLETVTKHDNEMLVERYKDIVDNSNTVEGRIKLNQLLRRYLSKIVLTGEKGEGQRLIEVFRKDNQRLLTIKCDNRFSESIIDGEGFSEAYGLSKYTRRKVTT